MPEPDIYDIADDFRRAMLARERAAASEMVHYYGEVWKRILIRLDALDAEYRAIKESGGKVSGSWIYEWNRLKSLRGQVEREVADFARFVEERIKEGQLFAVHEAEAAAERMGEIAGLRASAARPYGGGVFVAWNRLPTSAVESMVGTLQDGSPLRDLLNALPNDAGAVVADRLVQGLALGKNPRSIAREIRKGLGENLVRALRISRTEVMRSYREATRQSYQANSDVVAGWVWLSALNERTCPACWAMHGTEHKLDERLDDHPQGRCTMVPLFKGETKVVPTGVEEFEKLTDEKKLAVLGPGKLVAYRRKWLTLDEDKKTGIVGHTDPSRWGTFRFERGLEKVVGKKRAQEIYQSKEYKGLLQQMALNRRPVDKLLTEILAGQVEVTDGVVDRIARHVARADFYEGVVPVKADIVGKEYLGRVIEKREDALFAHLVKRVLGDKQWADGTTEAVFAKDLRNVVRKNDFGMALYERHGGTMLMVVGDNNLAKSHKGEKPEALLAVLYSANRGKIISGYQASSLDTLDIEENAIWLRKLKQ